ncbi:MAG: tetratricopeptide repeat protein [Prevotella sp.]|nr:tetratricopeptide repeat protein [Prevotella sp.]
MKKSLLLKAMLFSLLLSSLPLRTIYAQVTIEMEKQGDLYLIPGKVNGVDLKFIFDTGASNVCISLVEALFMVKNGYLSEEDIVGTSYSQIANGDIDENTEIVLREIDVAGIKLQNVRALVSHTLQAPLLFGQSAIQKLGPIQIEGNKLTIANGRNFKSDEEAHSLYLKAVQANEAMAYNQAIALCTEGLKYAVDKNLRSWLFYELAYAYNGLDEKEEAIDASYKGLAENTWNLSQQYNLGCYLYDAGYYDKAENAFKRLLNLVDTAPQNLPTWELASAYGHLGLIQMRHGQCLTAENSFKKAIELYPNKDDVDIQAYYNGLGDACYEQKKYAEAIEPYEKAASLEYKVNGRYYKLAYCYLNTDQTEKAMDNFKKFLDVFGTNINILQEVVTTQDFDDDTKEWARDMIGMSVDATIRLGMLYYIQNDYVSATTYANIIMSSFNDVLVNDFQFRDFLWFYDLYLNKNKDTETAQRLYNAGMEKYPDNPDILFFKCLSLEDAEEEVNLYKKIIAQENTYKPICLIWATAYNNLAWAYYNLDKSELGLPYAEKSVQMDASHDFSWGTLGRIYFNLGRYNDCITAMTKCAEIPNCRYIKAAYEFIGNSYIALGKKKEGKRWLEKAELL